jgi:uncharacterized membrane protein
MRGDEMTILEALGVRVVGPFLLGLVIVFAMHDLAGRIALRRAKGNDKKLERSAEAYMEIINRLRDTLFVWSVGLIVFMALGWI